MKEGRDPIIEIVDMVTDLEKPEDAIDAMVSAMSLVVLLIAKDKDSASEIVRRMAKQLLHTVLKNHDQTDMVRHCIDLIKQDPEDIGTRQ